MSHHSSSCSDTGHKSREMSSVAKDQLLSFGHASWWMQSDAISFGNLMLKERSASVGNALWLLVRIKLPRV